MIKLYQAEWCPWCHLVRQQLSELGLTYTTINVPVEKPERKRVKKVSGQDAIPVLVDGDTVLTDSVAIVHYLHTTYPPAADAVAQSEAGAFRWLVEFDDTPARVLKRVKDALAREGFRVVAQVRGDKLSPRLSRSYVLMHVAVPAAALEAIAVDPTVATVVTTPLVIFPVEGGTAVVVTKPGAGSWLYNEPALLDIAGTVAARMAKVIESLLQRG